MPVFSSVIVTSALGTAAPCGSLTVPVMFPVVLDWAYTPASSPTLSRSNDARTQDLIDIQHLLSVSVAESRTYSVARVLFESKSLAKFFRVLLCCSCCQKHLIPIPFIVKDFLFLIVKVALKRLFYGDFVRTPGKSINGLCFQTIQKWAKLSHWN